MIISTDELVVIKDQTVMSIGKIESPVPMRIAPSPTLSDGGIFTDFNSNFGSTQK